MRFARAGVFAANVGHETFPQTEGPQLPADAPATSAGHQTKSVAPRKQGKHTTRAGKEFRRVESSTDFELYLPRTLTRLPEELHIEARRFPRRVESYWDGLAWIT